MNRYITTTLPYVNASPHIGFALEIVQADVLARGWRAQNDSVFFSTGTDEHGQKIFEAAQKAGEAPQDYVDRYAAEVAKLKDALNLSYDAFIRTTDVKHVKAAQEMWRLCAESGDVYKKTYAGKYCVGCEEFKTEKDLSNGKCLLHPNLDIREISEENYFFRFSKYQEQLLTYLERPGVIEPEWRRQEAINFVKKGLEDFSISREAARFSWGIPVPGDDSQVMYVWFDALTNYISTLGWPDDKSGTFKKYWDEGATLQVAGKDQVRFQSLIWQAMLFSAKIKNTDTIFYHGFVTSGGQKMSKSLGNVIDPLQLVAKYGTDATRYILLRHVSPFEDSDLTLESIQDHYTAHLTNGLGNVVARVMKLAETHLTKPIDLDGVVPVVVLTDFAFNRAMDEIWADIQRLDQEITDLRPFELVKTDEVQGKSLIGKQVKDIYQIALKLNPFMPKTSETIARAVKENKKPENLFPRI